MTAYYKKVLCSECEICVMNVVLCFQPELREKNNKQIYVYI